MLDGWVGELATNETFGIKNGVGWVHCCLILSGVTDETLGVGEGDVRWGGTVTLFIRNDFNTIVLPGGGGSRETKEKGEGVS